MYWRNYVGDFFKRCIDSMERNNLTQARRSNEIDDHGLVAIYAQLRKVDNMH